MLKKLLMGEKIPAPPKERKSKAVTDNKDKKKTTKKMELTEEQKEAKRQADIKYRKDQENLRQHWLVKKPQQEESSKRIKQIQYPSGCFFPAFHLS